MLGVTASHEHAYDLVRMHGESGGGGQVPAEHPDNGEDRQQRADQTHDDRTGPGGLGPARVPPPREILGKSSAPAPNNTAAAANTSAHQPWVCQPLAYKFSSC